MTTIDPFEMPREEESEGDKTEPKPAAPEGQAEEREKVTETRARLGNLRWDFMVNR